MIIASVAVDRVTARVSSCEAIPRGIVGAQVKLQFRDPDWEGLTKTAVFRGCVTRTVMVRGDTVVIPWETVARAGQKLWIGLYGVGEAGKLEIPTVWAELGTVAGAADPSADPGAQATPELWAQLADQMGDLKYLETETGESLVAAINELVEMGIGAGEPGADGKSAYQYAQSAGYAGTEAEFAAKLADSRVYLPAPETAKAGQIILVSAVDDSGRVTATEAVEILDAEGGLF